MHYLVPALPSLWTLVFNIGPHTYIHTHRGRGCLIFMVCSITYHYKYLLWFTLLSGCFSLSLSPSVSSTPWRLQTPAAAHISGITLVFSPWVSENFPSFITYLLYALSYCCFSPFCFTIRLLMVFRCCIDSVYGSLSVSAWITLSLFSSSYLSGSTWEDAHVMRIYAGLICI